jgi:hypothetical protein
MKFRDLFFKGLIRSDNANSNDQRSRQSQSVGPPIRSYEVNGDDSSLSSDLEYGNNRESAPWKPTGFQAVSFSSMITFEIFVNLFSVRIQFLFQNHINLSSLLLKQKLNHPGRSGNVS